LQFMNKMAITIIIKLIYFMLPAYLANMAPVLGKNILKPLAIPIDFGKKWNKQPILGKNKTWRGVLLAVIASTIIFLIQSYLYKFPSIKSISLIDYSSASLWIAFLLGLGAIAGDSIESFFKRRAKIPSGNPWIPFDQIDFTVGALILTAIIYFPGWLNAILIILISAVGHILINHLAFYFKIRKEKW